MKILLLIIGIVMFAGFGGYLFSHGNRSTNPKISSEKITKEIGTSAQLVDVRTSLEFNQEHAIGAINVPLQDIQAGNLSDLDKNKTLYLYCRSGNRSGQAAQILKQKGFTVVDIKSLDAWKKMGGASE